MDSSGIRDVLLIARFMASLPGLTFYSFRCGIRKEPLGFLLGSLLLGCLVSIVWCAPKQDHPALWVFGTLGVLLAILIKSKG